MNPPALPGSPHPAAGSARVLGRINDQIALDLLTRHGPLTRSAIGELTGLSKPTVSALIARLTARGLVIDAGTVTGGSGPPRHRFAINGAAGHLIAIQVRHDGCRAALVDLAGRELRRCTIELSRKPDDDPRVEISRVVDELRDTADGATIDQIAIASPGVIDPRTGTLRHARHLPGWHVPAVADRLAEHLGAPVLHGNDINLAAIAEGALGAARGEADFALLWLDRGVGLGLVLGGDLRTGAHGGAGEVGYLPVSGASPRVDRGAPGAFQQLVGAAGIDRLRREAGLPRGTAPEVIAAAVRAAAEEDHPLGHRARRFLDELADRLALGIASITAIADPAVVIVGGPHAEAGGPQLIRLIAARLSRHAFVRAPLAASSLGSDAILAGAIHTGLGSLRQRLFATPDQ